MKTKLFYLFVVSLVCFQSCSKGEGSESISKSFVVLDSETKAPVSNALIILWSRCYDYYGCADKQFKSGTTDINGKVRLSWSSENSADFLYCTADGYYLHDEYYDSLYSSYDAYISGNPLENNPEEIYEINLIAQ